jgi:hypothetical protein
MLSFIFVFHEIKIEKQCIYQVVGTANQPHLARQLIEFLLSQRRENKQFFVAKRGLLYL